MKIEYLQTIRKRDFEENSKNFLTAGHLVFLRPFPAAGHIATDSVFLMGTTVIRTMSVTGRKVTKQICYFKFTTSNAKHLKQSLRAMADQISFNKLSLFYNLPGLS